MTEQSLNQDGFCVLPGAVDRESVRQLISECDQVFAADTETVRARSSRGHVYAARNLIHSVPLVSEIWRDEPFRSFVCAGEPALRTDY